MKRAQAISHAIGALRLPHLSTKARDVWKKRLKDLEKALPSGAGIDNGTKIDLEASTPDRLVFVCAFHHMNDFGFYVRWTEHRIVVTPSFVDGVSIKVGGPNYRQIKDYLADVYYEALTEEVESW